MFDEKEYMKKYYQDNKGKIDKQHKQWRKDNSEKINQYSKQWSIDNPEYKHQWYLDNRAEKIAQAKQWQKDNPEKANEKSKRWKKNNSEKVKESNGRYNKTEEGRAAIQRKNSKRRAIMKEIINTLTYQEWLDILKKHNYKCFYCGIKFDENTLPERDHIIPISKGGNNIKKNVVPACRSCNAKKHNKIIKEKVKKSKKKGDD